jgi:hypothetical protein
VIPAVVILKDRPLNRSHRLYATVPPGHCSCGTRLVVATADQYQAALDLAALNHRMEL